MSKSIFIGGSCHRVYNREQIAELEKSAGLSANIITLDNFFEQDFSDTEYIFSSWGMLPFDEKMFAAMPKLKAVFYAAGATDAFALPFLERGIKVSSAWTANAIPVAEFATAQIILSLKDYFRYSRSMTGPEARKMPRTCPGVYGETVALIGSGTISTLVRKMLANYNVNVLDINQTVMQGFFTMMMAVDVSACNIPVAELVTEMAKIGENMGLSIRVQREDIFQAMHRI